jgi:hypothetical protein
VRADVGRVVEVEIPGSLPQQYFTSSDSAAPEAFQVEVSLTGWIKVQLLLKGTGSRDRIQIFGQKFTVLLGNKNHSWFSHCQNAPMVRCRKIAIFPRGLGENMGEITFIGEIPTEFFCGPRSFLLVHCKTLDSY